MEIVIFLGAVAFVVIAITFFGPLWVRRLMAVLIVPAIAALAVSAVRDQNLIVGVIAFALLAFTGYLWRPETKNHISTIDVSNKVLAILHQNDDHNKNQPDTLIPRGEELPAIGQLGHAADSSSPFHSGRVVFKGQWYVGRIEGLDVPGDTPLVIARYSAEGLVLVVRAATDEEWAAWLAR